MPNDNTAESPSSGQPTPRPHTVGDLAIESLYRTMQLIRRCEEQLARSYQRGLIHGACHTYVGQEAIAAGVCAHLRESDVVFSTHRGHGHALAKGLPPRELFAELFGRQTGCSRGRGGSMHLFAPEIGLMGTSGIVGPNILQAVGAGYSFSLLKSDRVAIAFFGDGAVNNGAFHEGLNMASIWKLPVVFVCENNQYATEVPFNYASAIRDVGRRAANYAMIGFEVDGNDAVSVYDVAREAIKRARSGGGPTLLECKTYRTRAHAEGMGNFGYRTKEEVEQWKTRCPLQRLREEQGGAEGSALRQQFAAIDQEIEQVVDAAFREAEQAAWPSAAEATRHVYCEEPATVPPAPPPGVRETNFVAATREALEFEMARNPRIFVMGEGIGQRGGNFLTTKGLYELFGSDRLCDTPICERGFVGLGCGAAMTGTRPVID
ncbi:MAG TPA: thiamine pyrophosphate-dependent enzyme, partial [Pirellulales bacterium]|nr:thiamine pyrophosphate-dependent enzyme [Pirellulales bacterium]